MSVKANCEVSMQSTFSYCFFFLVGKECVCEITLYIAMGSKQLFVFGGKLKDSENMKTKRSESPRSSSSNKRMKEEAERAMCFFFVCMCICIICKKDEKGNRNELTSLEEWNMIGKKVQKREEERGRGKLDYVKVSLNIDLLAHDANEWLSRQGHLHDMNGHIIPNAYEKGFTPLLVKTLEIGKPLCKP
ncbi:hypothetical protein RFI_03142, partial [Reticulomyxa filosa]